MARSHKFKWPFLIMVQISLVLLMALAYQNCGEGFSTMKVDSIDGPTGQGDNLGGPNPNTEKPKDTMYTTVKSCMEGVGLANLVNCLKVNQEKPVDLTQSTVDSCATSVGEHPLFISECLSRKGFIVHNRRSVKQFDIQQCSLKVGPAQVAKCLEKNGLLPEGLMQSDLDLCSTNDGSDNIEKCLRKKGFLAKHAATLSELKICELVGGEDNAGQCLLDAEVVPTSLTQADINECRNDISSPNVIHCLRSQKGLLPKVLLQAHINQCAEYAGPGLVMKCLEANALAPEKEEVGHYVPLSQSEFDECTKAVGLGSSIKCLRKNSYLPAFAMQPHINRCSDFAGQDKIASCLEANGLQANNLSQQVVNSCMSASGLDQTARCLANNKILPQTASQSQLWGCARYAGQENLATCLDSHGILPQDTLGKTPTQTTLVACISAVGLPHLEDCLKLNTYLPYKYSEMIASTGVFGQHCAGCHLNGGASGGMSLDVYDSISQRVNPSDPMNSKIYIKISQANPSIGGVRMPAGGPYLSALQIKQVLRWIQEGALKN